MKVANNTGVSLVSSCMSRNENLYNSLRSWIPHNSINEIVIVDWNSNEPIYDFISENFNMEKIKIIKVNNAHRWTLSWAYNLGFQNCSFDKILKLDSDIILSSDFFKKYQLDKSSFFRGCWKISRNENENNLNDQCFCHKENLFKVNLYNEKIVSYGWDDDDLYIRLSKSGLEQFFINPKDLFHIEHEDKDRISNQPEFSYIKNEDLRTAINYKIWKNKNFTENNSWGINDKIKKWKTTKIKNNYFLAEIC